MTDKGLVENIKKIKKDYGEKLIVLAHHYIRDDVYDLADFQGDSLGLSRKAAETSAKYIVFCGVRFMAESARVLARTDQKVIHPRVDAGCPLADQAPLREVEDAWQKLTSVIPKEDLVPLLYINSSIDTKVFCGKNNGVICTSSSAEKILEKLFEQGKTVFFLPDQHLGRYTAFKLGLKDKEMLLWQKEGANLKKFAQAKIILWPGSCYVHQKFLGEHIEEKRKQDSDFKIIVHPECDLRVCKISDFCGSTKHIIETVTKEKVEKWLIGTEANLVLRLAKRFPQKKIFPLILSYCLNMNKFHLEDLYRCLKNLEQIPNVHEIILKEEEIKWARKALNQMMKLCQ